MMANKTAPQTTDQLRAALAEAESREADLAERRRVADMQVQREAWQKLVDEYEGIEARLIEEGKTAYRRFQDAVASGDPNYLAEWTNFRAVRWHRTHLRSAYQNACYQLGNGKLSSDLRYVAPSLTEDIQTAVENAARRLGAERYDEYTGPIETARKAARDAVKA